MVWACLYKGSWVGCVTTDYSHGKGLSEEETQQESHSEQSGEMDDLKYLAPGHLFRLINVSGAVDIKVRDLSGLWLSSIDKMSAQHLQFLIMAETQEKLKPLQSEIGLKLVVLWFLPSELLFAHRFPLLCYFPSLHLQLLSPWYKLLHVSVSAAGSLRISKEPLL